MANPRNDFCIENRLALIKNTSFNKIWKVKYILQRKVKSEEVRPSHYCTEMKNFPTEQHAPTSMLLRLCMHATVQLIVKCELSSEKPIFFLLL